MTKGKQWECVFFECANGLDGFFTEPVTEYECDQIADDYCGEADNIVFIEGCYECEECNPDWFVCPADTP